MSKVISIRMAGWKANLHVIPAVGVVKVRSQIAGQDPSEIRMQPVNARDLANQLLEAADDAERQQRAIDAGREQ